MTTPNYTLDEMAAGQDAAYLDFNNALRFVEAMARGAISRTNGGPPGSPSDGDTYIVDSATGNWNSFSVDDIAYRDGTNWVNWTPIKGTKLYVNDEERLLVYGDSGWVPMPGTTGVFTHDFVSDADYTLTDDEASNIVIEMTDTSPTILTAARNVVVPDRTGVYALVNQTGEVLTIKTSAGTGVAVAAGTSALVYSDGVDVNRLSPDT